MNEHYFHECYSVGIQVEQNIDTVRIHIVSWRAKRKFNTLNGLKYLRISTPGSVFFQISLASLEVVNFLDIYFLQLVVS